jgi:general secretion pathway protein B
MSYILQALKKAEAQRKLGQVPDAGSVLGGPESVLAATPAAAADATGRRLRWWPAGGVVLLGVVGVLAAVAWVLWRAPQQSVPTPALAQAQAPAPAVAAAPVAIPNASPAPAPPPVIALAEPPVAAEAPATPPAAPPQAASAQDVAPARHLADMPPAQRAGLPPLQVGGSVLSPRRSERLLMLDGQVRREGDALAPGWVLEAIEPGHAVLRSGQERWRLPL